MPCAWALMNFRPGRSLPARRGAQALAAQQSADRGGRHSAAQLDELSPNAQAPPSRILFGHAKHHLDDSRFQRWTAAAGMAPKSPLAAHEFPVPAQESGRGDQKRVPGASGKNPAGGG